MEKNVRFEGASALGNFEFKHLDQDAGTEGLAAWTEIQWNDRFNGPQPREV